MFCIKDVEVPHRYASINQTILNATLLREKWTCVKAFSTDDF